MQSKSLSKGCKALWKRFINHVKILPKRIIKIKKRKNWVTVKNKIKLISQIIMWITINNEKTSTPSSLWPLKWIKNWLYE